LLLSLLLLSLIIAPNVAASENFTVDANVEYKIQESGVTTVTNTFSVKNNTSELFSKNYVLNLTGVNPKNLKAFEGGDQLSVFSQQENDYISVRIEFPNPVTGIGKERTFVITYEESSFALKTGEVWEISIPKLESAESFREYNVYISIPDSFGEEAYISPEPREIRNQDSRKIYLFKKDDIKKVGVTGGFGKFQVFSFTINYHLENTSNEKTTSQIALPPDTSTQEMFYQEITPVPLNVLVDEDGNWLAEYNLSPRQRLDVKVTGRVSVFAKPRKIISPSPSTLLSDLKPTKYWQSDDPKISDLAKSLGTPQKMYEYITQTLSYNYDRVTPNVERLGAKSALDNPGNAICMEFTDLFVALARANGIPAREINGFAYSENPKIQPLSLVADVLHSWPEYWDKDTGTWIPIDPTWGTTSQRDYFNKLDLRHFAFVIHGTSDTSPVSAGSYKLGTNPQKDVFVSLGTSHPKSQSKIDIGVSYPNKFELFKKTANVRIVNNGLIAVYDITTQILFDETSIYSEYFPVLPPNAHVDKQVEIPLGVLGLKAPLNVKVLAYRTEKALSTQKSQVIIYQILLLSFIFIAVVIFASYKMRKGRSTFLERIYAKIKKTKDNPKAYQ